jgi:SPP1 gp7 family putative phage head morphogenesis protein
MNSKEYWEKREDEALKNYITDEERYDREIERIYTDMLENVQKEIDRFYRKYADDEGISINEAMKRVSEADIKAYERKAQRYVKDASLDRAANKGKTNKKGYYFSEQANEEMKLYNLTMKVNRLEMLKANIGMELIKGHAELDRFMEEILRGRTEEELKRQAGILGKTIKNNAKAAHAIPNASYKDATFSDRIWMHQSLMKADLDKMLKTGLIQGRNARALAGELEKYFIGEPEKKNGKKGARYVAERLMRTELARVQTEAQRQSFVANGFTQYMFIVNGRCCSECEAVAKENNGIYDIENLKPGSTAPPIHPFCRCSIAVYEDSDEYEAWLDYLEAGGTTKEWNKTGKAQWEKNAKQSGGKFTVGDPEWYERRDNEAEQYYEIVRTTNDVLEVAKSSGMLLEEIEAIKNHIFFNKHIKYDGAKERFDADYDMAVAWKRLVDGKPKERDYLLLQHELLESQVEKEYNLTAAEAHEKAEAVYAWDEKLFSDLGEDGEKDGLLQFDSSKE